MAQPFPQSIHLENNTNNLKLNTNNTQISKKIKPKIK